MNMYERLAGGRAGWILILGTCLIAAGCADDRHDVSHEHGVIEFTTSCNHQAQSEFETGLAHLHHMMYEQARPRFEAAAEADPDCAMAQWGIAMTSFYPLWMPTPDDLLERGKSAVSQAREIGPGNDREEAWIDAVDAFFTDPVPAVESRPADHAARLAAWVDRQRALYEAYPDDVDAAAFLSLAEISLATAQFSPGEERDYSLQREAGARLDELFSEHPQHPGLFHYIIHAYDSPALADKAVEAARGYDQLAPDTPHALHMPSHIFVRLGQWEETIDWNERSARAALRQAETDGHAKLHYVHALDYMMYGQLQLGLETEAEETLRRVRTVDYVPQEFVSAYGVAAPQARYYLEQRMWEESAALEYGVPDILEWDRVPGAAALFSYARGLGAARSGNLELARAERDRIEDAVLSLRDAGDHYWAYMTEAIGDAVEAWIHYKEGDTVRALELIAAAADLEDSMDKHPVTPGEILPVRELYGEMLLLEGRGDEAVQAFEQSLERTPNRAFALTGIDEAQSIAVR